MRLHSEYWRCREVWFMIILWHLNSIEVILWRKSGEQYSKHRNRLHFGTIDQSRRGPPPQPAFHIQWWRDFDYLRIIPQRCDLSKCSIIKITLFTSELHAIKLSQGINWILERPPTTSTDSGRQAGVLRPQHGDQSTNFSIDIFSKPSPFPAFRKEGYGQSECAHVFRVTFCSFRSCLCRKGLIWDCDCCIADISDFLSQQQMDGSIQEMGNNNRA